MVFFTSTFPIPEWRKVSEEMKYAPFLPSVARIAPTPLSRRDQAALFREDLSSIFIPERNSSSMILGFRISIFPRLCTTLSAFRVETASASTRPREMEEALAMVSLSRLASTITTGESSIIFLFSSRKEAVISFTMAISFTATCISPFSSVT